MKLTTIIRRAARPRTRQSAVMAALIGVISLTALACSSSAHDASVNEPSPAKSATDAYMNSPDVAAEVAGGVDAAQAQPPGEDFPTVDEGLGQSDMATAASGAATVAEVQTDPVANQVLAAPNLTDRSLVRQVALTLEVGPYDSSGELVEGQDPKSADPKLLTSTLSQIANIASGLGGYTENSSLSKEAGYASAVVSVRVPVANYEQALDQVSKLGREVARSSSDQDVGGQLVDLDARIKNLQREEETLQLLFDKAQNIEDILRVEPKLFEIRQQIEQLQAQKSFTTQQAALSTINVSLDQYIPENSSTGENHEEKSTLAKAFDTAIRALLNLLGGLLIVLVVALPLALIAWILWKLYRRVAPKLATGSPDEGSKPSEPTGFEQSGS